MEATLPKLPKMAGLFPPVTTRLFEGVDKPIQIAVVRQSDHEGVEMVRHNAVRKNFKLLRRSNLQELLYDVSRDDRILKYGRSQIDANREEIPELADIVELWESRRCV